jgi:hypothetical protein
LTIVYLHYLCFDRLPPDETLKYVVSSQDPFILNWELIAEQYNSSNTNNNNNNNDRQRTIPTLQTLRDFFEETLKLLTVLFKFLSFFLSFTFFLSHFHSLTHSLTHL